MTKSIWDEVKNQANLKKHGVDFDDAVRALYDPDRMDFFDKEHSTDMPALKQEQLARFVPAKVLNRSHSLVPNP